VYGGRVNFAVSATSYDRFMGRYSAQLSPQLADLAGVEAGQRVLDVGAGSGMLTAELVERLGPAAASAGRPAEADGSGIVGGPLESVVEGRQRHGLATVRHGCSDERVRDVRVPRQERAMQVGADPQTT